jgi:peptide/nickel transport system substrate-binding protein
MPADINGWTPDKTQGTYGAWPYEAVYDTVIKCNAAAAPEPDIAASWSIANQNTLFTAHLRSGMKFSDGTPLNAVTVKQALDISTHTPGAASTWAGVTFAAPNDSTLVVKSATPNPNLATDLCTSPIASPKYLKSGTESYPVGSGPYTLDRSASVPGSSYTFVKNQSYFDASAFPFAKVVMDVIASPTAMINALKTGQINAGSINAQTSSEATSAGLGVNVLQGETARLLITDHEGKVVKALGNVDVRRAINMVFDKSQIATALYNGQATPTDQVAASGSAGYIKNYTDPYPYNIAQAKKLMAAAGYAKGFSIDLPTFAGVADSIGALIPVVVQQMAQIGITVHQVPLTGPNAISELLSGKYPLLLWPLGNYGNTIYDIQQSMLTASNWNVEHQPDSTVTALYSKLVQSTGAAFSANEQAIYQYAYTQAWFVPLDYVPLYYAYSKTTVSIPSVSDYAQLNPLLYDFKQP